MTTYTDYVNKYTAVLQTTCLQLYPDIYNWGSIASVMTPTGVYSRNPTQHAADLRMLESHPEVQPAFTHPETRQPKQIECIRVDGASDDCTSGSTGVSQGQT